jgi:nucleoside-triphosphatase
VIDRLVGRLAGLRLVGFLTEEVRENGQRVGFRAVGLATAKTALLADVRHRSACRVGRYGVDPDALAHLLAAELAEAAGGVDLYVIDEIGKMELCCPRFVEAMPQLLGGEVPVVATVALQGGGLIAAVKARPDVQVVEVTAANRDSLPADLETWARKS